MRSMSRINSLSTEVQNSVRDIEGGLNQLHQVVEDKHNAMNAVFEDQANVEIGSLLTGRPLSPIPAVCYSRRDVETTNT